MKVETRESFAIVQQGPTRADGTRLIQSTGGFPNAERALATLNAHRDDWYREDEFWEPAFVERTITTITTETVKEPVTP